MDLYPQSNSGLEIKRIDYICPEIIKNYGSVNCFTLRVNNNAFIVPNEDTNSGSLKSDL